MDFFCLCYNHTIVGQKRNTIHQLYIELLEKHGSPEKLWPEWCTSQKSSTLRETIALGAILTQRTSWRNADLALGGLKKERLLSIKKINNLKSLADLTRLIRPAGFYQSKPKRLQTFCSFIVSKYKNIENFRKVKLELARKELLSLNGIGPETADTILLYALDKPSFVIDEYTKRLIKKRGLSNKFKYDDLKQFFEKCLPKSVKVYQNFHALIIVEQKGKGWSTMKKVLGR